jgi:RNA polymerase sigma-70 factor (ECF subfamily)
MQLDEWIAALARRVAADLSREPPPDVLWQRFRDEDDQYAAVVLIARHGRPVWNFCRSALADYQAAEEVFQDTFRDLYRRRHRIRHHAAVRGWLLRTARHKVRDAWRRQGCRPVAVSLNPDVDLAVSPTEAGTDAEAARREVYRLLGRLPRNQRRAIELVKLAGLSPAEAAAELGVPEGTVWSWVSRGLNRLREIAGGGLAAAGGLTLLELAPIQSTVAVPVELIGTTATSLATRSVVTQIAGTWVRKKTIAIAASAAGVALVAGLIVAAVGPSARPPIDPPLTVLTPAPPETLQERNRRLVERDVIPAVLRELASIPGGENVRLVSSDVYDTRIELVVEGNVVRVLNYDVKAPRMRLIYDTDDGWKCLLMQFHEPGRWTMVLPDRPQTIPVWFPSLGWNDIEVPSTPFQRVWAAFGEIPFDRRTATEARLRDDALMAAVRPWIGTWGVREQNLFPLFIRWDRRHGLIVKGAGWNEEHCFRLPAWSSISKQNWLTIDGFGGRISITPDGSRIDRELFKEGERQTWVRAEVVAAGEALPPQPGRDLTGIWEPHGDLKGLFVILHRPDGRIHVLHEGGTRTCAALNGRNELHTASSPDWTRSRGIVSPSFDRITWDSTPGTQVWWSRRPAQEGSLTGIWYRDGRSDRTCAIVEPSGNDAVKHLRLVDECDRQTAAMLANGVISVESNSEWNRHRGSMSGNPEQIDWDTGAPWHRRPGPKRN